MFDPVLSSLPAFAGYFATAIGLLAVFVLLYVFVTPYNEMALIRAGNDYADLFTLGAQQSATLATTQALSKASHRPQNQAGASQ